MPMLPVPVIIFWLLVVLRENTGRIDEVGAGGGNCEPVEVAVPAMPIEVPKSGAPCQPVSGVANIKKIVGVRNKGGADSGVEVSFVGGGGIAEGRVVFYAEGGGGGGG